MLTMDSEQWVEQVTQAGARLNIALSREHVGRFFTHAQLLLAWNRKINLTAITDPMQIAVKHFLDSVAPLAHIPVDGELLDMGTGGGFPGIPLKIMRPFQPMTLMDGTRKKISFVKQVIRELGLNQIQAVHQRAEQMGLQETYAGRYAAIVCRAVADLQEVARLAYPMLAEGGTIVVYKGPGEVLPDVLWINAGQGQGAAVGFQVTAVAYPLPVYGDPRRVVLLRAMPPVRSVGRQSL
jgi:16S rRNA (guanine527-N7)-methyltransferase